MAITFLEKRKKLKHWFPILTIIILITLLVLWQGFFVQKKVPVAEEILERQIKKIEIDFQILEALILEEFLPFEKIPPFEGEIGRENPFLPY